MLILTTWPLPVAVSFLPPLFVFSTAQPLPSFSEPAVFASPFPKMNWNVTIPYDRVPFHLSLPRLRKRPRYNTMVISLKQTSGLWSWTSENRCNGHSATALILESTRRSWDVKAEASALNVQTAFTEFADRQHCDLTGKENQKSSANAWQQY